jgi:hypothetical protein
MPRQQTARRFVRALSDGLAPAGRRPGPKKQAAAQSASARQRR